MMKARLIVAGCFLALFAFGVYRQLDASPLGTSRGASEEALRNPEPGTFPEQWINGVDCESEPPFQVHAYNDNLVIIRQSKCESYEAPFLYLIFGDEKALLMDTGANPISPVADEVFAVIDDWLAANGRESIPLIVAHTHGHFDHTQGDAQFIGRPGVEQVVPAGTALIPFWGFTDYPNDIVTIDLGDRVLDVIGTPGHHPQSVTLYDRRTGLLMTGDLVYPGHLFIFSPGHWEAFKESIHRLAVFSIENPVSWVVGCHVEMSAEPFEPYAYGTKAQPNEHVLEFDRIILRKILRASREMGDDPQCQVFEEFVIHPVYKCGIFWNG